MARVRSWLGIGDPSDAEHRAAAERLDRLGERVRVARIDAGLPVDRRMSATSPNPGRRTSDGHAG